MATEIVRQAGFDPATRCLVRALATATARWAA